MSKTKKIIFAAVAVILVVALAVGGVLGVKKANAKSVLVVPVADMSYYWPSYDSLEGQVSTSVTQYVKLEDDAIIDQVFVKVGDHVRRGDKLLSFDMTLKQMEYEIAILTRQQQQQELKKAKDRLHSLENGGPIVEESENQGIHPGPGTGSDEDVTGDPLFGDSEGDDDLEETAAPGSDLAMADETGSRGTVMAVGTAVNRMTKGMLTAAAGPMLASFEEEIPGFSPEEPTETPMPTETPEPDPSVTPDPEEEPGEKFYKVLTTLEEAYAGTGTKEDPYVFLCSSAEGEVRVKGSFLNEAAGYDAKGEELLAEDGYWFRLEFHQEDQLKEEPSSLIGYYVRDGGLMPNPIDPEDEEVFTLSHASMPELEFDPEQVVTPTPTPEPEDPFGDEEWGDGGWDDGGDQEDPGEDGGLTREEAIELQKRTIKELELQIKASDIKISRMERELEKQTVVSTVNGTVTKMGDPVSGTYEGKAFMEIQSDGGYYVTGSLSELMLDTLQVGDLLSCTSYETGNMFQAEITEISEFPGNNSGYYGTGNTNASFYPFVAAVKDEVELNNYEGVNITLDDTTAQETDIVEITQAFVRSEGGQYYVYKDDNGILKKQVVDAKVSTDGYSVRILSGLTQEDKIAFPYGKEVKEGAKTKEGTMDELYGY